jgi:RNA polymerase sigma factor for flagellar operon FliA
MGKEIESFHRERGQAARFETIHLEDLSEHVLNLPDEKAKQPDTVAEDSEFMQAVVEAIEDLPSRDKLVMSLYYQEELNLKEIGEILGVSESRVSQILSQNVKKLRAVLFEEPVA